MIKIKNYANAEITSNLTAVNPILKGIDREVTHIVYLIMICKRVNILDGVCVDVILQLLVHLIYIQILNKA